MARNLVIFSVALVVGLGLAWWLLGDHGTGGTAGGVDRTGGETGGGDERAEGAGTRREGEERRGPVLFGRPRTDRVGLGGVSGRVADVENDTAIAGARLLLAGVGFGDEEVQIRGASLEDGTFQLADVPAGDGYVLRVTAEEKPERQWPGISVRDGVVTRLGTVWLGAKLDFEGRVVDAAGLGIAGADVKLFVGHFSLMEMFGNLQELFADLDSEPEPHARAVTDEDGVFRFRTLDPGPVTLSVRARGYAPGSLSAVVAPSSESAKPLLVRLSRGGVIAGRVVDPSDRPISGARIAVLTDSSPFSFFFGRTFVDTLGDGTFRVDTAGGDRVQLMATYPGYPLTITRASAGDQDVEIVLERGATLVVTVLAEPDGEPVESALVMLSTSPTGSLSEEGKSLSTGTTDRAGTVTFDVMPGQLQMVVVTHPTRPSGMWAGGPMGSMVPGAMKGPEDPTIEKGRREVVFRMRDTVLVRGRVTDESGAGIGGARVMTFGGFQFGKPVHTGEDGVYELPVVPGPTGMVLAQAAGFVQAMETVVIGPDSPEVTERNFTLIRAAVVSGRVLDEKGRPIAGAQVRADAVAEGAANVALAMLGGTATGATGASGRYVLDGVPPGERVLIVAHRPGYVDQASEPFPVTPGGSVSGRDVTLTQGWVLEVEVLDPTGRPVEGAKVECAYDRPDHFAWDALEAFVGDAARVTDRDGRVREENVPRCDATITATHPAWAQATVTVQVALGQASPVSATVTLRRSMAIAGTVLDARGRPLEGASVVAEGSWRSDSTGKDGRFELARLPEGAVRLRVGAPGHQGRKVEVPQATTTLVVRLEAEDEDRAARRTAVLTRLGELGLKIQSASSDDERQALAKEIQVLQQELAELGGISGPPPAVEPVEVQPADEIELEEIEEIEEIEER